MFVQLFFHYFILQKQFFTFGQEVHVYLNNSGNQAYNADHHFQLRTSVCSNISYIWWRHIWDRGEKKKFANRFFNVVCLTHAIIFFSRIPKQCVFLNMYVYLKCKVSIQSSHMESQPSQPSQNTLIFTLLSFERQCLFRIEIVSFV